MPNAVITGATHGIGRAIAEKLLQNGFNVAVCARNMDELSKLGQQWEQQYPTAKLLCIDADFANNRDIADFALLILKHLGTVDILVNNAGIFTPGSIADEAEGNLEKLMQVNLYGAYHLTRWLLPVMKRQEAAHIFNMCSVASLKAYPSGGSYSITKYALMGFSENLRVELMPWNIKVTALCPGATDSRSWEGADVPKERIMEANDVAEMLWASYTLSKQANVETIVMRPIKGDL